MVAPIERTMNQHSDAPSPVPTVMVPGWMDAERTLRTFAAYLNKVGQRAYICSPQPSDLTISIEVMASALASFIDERYGTETPINLFGFSMGGLIGRVYLQKMDGWKRVQRFITVATPHKGTILARFAHRTGGQQMRPGSPFLTELNRDLSPLTRIQFTSIWSPLDLMIVPTKSSLLGVGRVQRVMSPAHVLMPYDPQVHRAVAEALA